MAPLAEYPNKPGKGETDGYDKLEAYDEVVQANIKAAFDLAGTKVDAEQAAEKFDELENTVGSKAAIADLETVNNKASDALFLATNAQEAVEDKLDDTDKAGLNKLGWAPAVFIPKGAATPVGLPPYTLVVEDK